MSSMGDVLREMRQVVRGVPGLNPDDYPSELDSRRVVTLIYPGPGRAQLNSSRGGGGAPNRWQLDTIIISVAVARVDLARDLEEVEPYAESVIAALFRAFADHRFNGTVVTFGDPTTPGSTWPVRRTLIFPQQSGYDIVGYQFEVDVSYQVDMLHD